MIRKAELACILGMTGAMISGMVQDATHTVHQLEGDVLRLHILANSDRADDQLLKYAVRDAVLREGSVYFQGLGSFAEAEARAAGCLPQLEEIARKTVAAYGYDYTVQATLEETAFEDRVYEALTMPAGTYTALRIQIGAAAGQNWWCVMYPPLCVPAAVEEPEDAAAAPDSASDHFTKKEEELLEQPERYRVRLKCAEWLRQVWDRLHAD